MRRALVAATAVLGALTSTFAVPRAEAAPITLPSSLRAATLDNGVTEARWRTYVRVPYGAYAAVPYGYGYGYGFYGYGPYGGRAGGIPLGGGTATSPGGIVGGSGWW